MSTTEDADAGGTAQPPLPAVPPLANVGLIVDAGRQRRKHIKRLRRGVGRVTAQIEAAVDQAREEFGIGPDTEIVPVVLLYDCPDRDQVILSPQT